MGKKVTIQDIADALGVSRNTVSKAINNSEGLAEETRAKIIEKAVELGYKQFSYVQTLYRAAQAEQEAAEKPKPKEIALLTTFYFGGSHFAATMLDRLQRELGQLGYRLNTHHVTKDDIKNRALPFTFLPAQVSAVVCIEMFDWEYDNMLCELGLPILFVDGPVRTGGRSLPADMLLMDNCTEIFKLLGAAIRRGVRRIGFLGDYEHCQSFFERYLAFRSVMTLENLPVEPKHVIKGIAAVDLYHELERLDDLPELFVCANDFVAYDTMQILRKLGKNVPDDVMLLGFDDAPESKMLVPALTTVHIHTQAMAYSAAQVLITRIQEPSLDYRTLYTSTDIVMRESTGSISPEEVQA